MQFTCVTFATELFFEEKTLVIKFSNAINMCDSCHLTVFSKKPCLLSFQMQFTCATLAIELFFQETALVIQFSNAVHLCDPCHPTVFPRENFGYKIFNCNSLVQFSPFNSFIKQKLWLISFQSNSPVRLLPLICFFLKRKPCFLKIQLQLTCATLAT